MQLKLLRYEPVHWIAALLFLAGLPLLVGCEDSQGVQAAKAPVPEVGTVIIAGQPVELSIELPGRTCACGVAEVRPQVNGIVQKRLFEEGSSVKAGQLLYQIDPAPFQAVLNSARASLAKAQATVPALRSRAERYKELLSRNAVSRQDYDDAAAALDLGMAEINYWKAEIARAEINVQHTRVAAPISGRIGRSSVTDGAMVTAYQATPLATIQQLNPMYVDVAQSTAELLSLRRSLESGRISNDGKSGSKVGIVLEDGSPYPLEGELKFRDVTSVDPTTGSYILRIVVPNPEYLLLPGMYVRAVVKEGTAQQAILIPQEGVTRTPKGEAVAWIVDDNDVVQQRKLSLDRAIGNKWLVASGLSAGERLIIEGRLKVKPGDKVKWVLLNAAPQDQKSS